MFKFFSNLSKKKEKQSEDLLTPQRFNDSILIVTQDNRKLALKIEAINNNALALLGYSNVELLGRDFREFVSESTKTDIEKNLRFGENGKSLSDVLTKIRHFKMKTKCSGEIPLRMRVVRSVSTINSPRFQLVINDNTVQQMLQEERAKYRLDMGTDEIYDPATDLLNRESIIKDLDTVSAIAAHKTVMGTLVLIEMKDYDNIKNNFDNDVLKSVVRQLAQKIQFSCREEDVVGAYDERSFAVILMETPYENIAVPLKRLKHTIENHSYDFYFSGIKNTTKISVSIAYRKILPNISAVKFLEDIKSGNGVVFE